MLLGYSNVMWLGHIALCQNQNAERKKQNCSRKKVTIKGGHLSVEHKIFLCGVTLNRTDINKFGLV